MKFSNLYNEIGKTFSDLAKAAKSDPKSYKFVDKPLYGEEKTIHYSKSKDKISIKWRAPDENQSDVEIFLTKENPSGIMQNLIESFKFDIKDDDDQIKELNSLYKAFGLQEPKLNEKFSPKEIESGLNDLVPHLKKIASNIWDVSFSVDGSYFASRKLGNQVFPIIVASVKKFIPKNDVILYQSTKSDGNTESFNNNSPRGRMYSLLLKKAGAKKVIDTNTIVIAKR